MSRKLVELLFKERLDHTKSVSKKPTSDFQARARDAIRQFIEKKTLSESKLLYFLTQKFSMQSINLAKFEVKPEVLGRDDGRTCAQDVKRFRFR